jgi:putative tRNA adenosine deaminase-associated protein
MGVEWGQKTRGDRERGVTYFAAMMARSGRDWSGVEVDILDIGDSDAMVDLLREAGKLGEPAVLLIEREDEWFGVVRLDDDELKIFVSDVYAAAHSDVGDVLVPTGDDVDVDDDAEEGGGDAGDGASVLIAVPGGDTDLLAAFGVDEDELLGLCAEEGMMPGDALSALAERVGCGEAYDGLR